MKFYKALKGVILFGMILVIVASVFLVAENINEKKVDTGGDNGTTTPVNTTPSEDNGKKVEPPFTDPVEEEKPEEPKEDEQETPPQEEEEPAKEPKEDRPQVAIIIDDLGYNPELDQELYQLDHSLTLAILPFRSHTRQTAETFKGKDNFELLLHLPLEPMDGNQKEENMATVDMDREEIASFLDDALEEMEGVEGINNHKGSRFTSDDTKMGYLLEEIRERGLFFVDSFTLGDSVAYPLALEMGIPTARRDVFIDYSDDKDAVIEKLQQLEDVARENGTAIGIGHHRKNTIQALKEELPRMKERGIELMLVSELLE
ncbi:MAG: divergent polysaccharide deacetylase family protein [Patescibacteria group bacterium]